MNGGGEYGKATMVLLCRAIDECDPPHESEPVQLPFRMSAGCLWYAFCTITQGAGDDEESRDSDDGVVAATRAGLE
ncbi:hypothetical protein AERO8C_70680 [Aeromonas veronii]|uniref:Uncharacterized protein n=1 Tax=Aeromonas veronii TaxID=654 RepID=A0A653LCH3_AERVE|nr:hypothetical protein AERO8C_70680 [Aeromonas veronii]